MNNQLTIQEITDYVEQNINRFHAKRLEKLENLNFKEIFYLYK
ncbi:MAG: hypothetical protein RL637_319 [Pseudomonadota bacterium]|jgi:hypothetical protein